MRAGNKVKCGKNIKLTNSLRLHRSNNVIQIKIAKKMSIINQLICAGTETAKHFCKPDQACPEFRFRNYGFRRIFRNFLPDSVFRIG